MLNKNMRFLLISFFAVASFAVIACESGVENEDQSSEDTTSVAMGDTVTSGGDDQEQSSRPSPPRTAEGQAGDMTIRIDYSTPGVKGRKIWGGLVAYDAVWRTGANEATVFQVNTDVEIEGEKLPAGKYSLFTIPREEDDWEVILNKEWDQWGAFNYDEDLDQIRFEVTPQSVDEFTERMKFDIEELDDQTARVTLQWENLRVPFDVKIAK